MVNEGKILKNDLPRMGGNWVWSFFLCSLLLPLKREGPRRLRYFLLCALALMAVVQPLAQTHASAESPDINSENLLCLSLAPLVLIFGTGFFLTLLDQIEFFDASRIRRLAAMLFPAVMIVPLFLDSG